MTQNRPWSANPRATIVQPLSATRRRWSAAAVADDICRTCRRSNDDAGGVGPRSRQPLGQPGVGLSGSDLTNSAGSLAPRPRRRRSGRRRPASSTGGLTFRSGGSGRSGPSLSMVAMVVAAAQAWVTIDMPQEASPRAGAFASARPRDRRQRQSIGDAFGPLIRSGSRPSGPSLLAGEHRPGTGKAGLHLVGDEHRASFLRLIRW